METPLGQDSFINSNRKKKKLKKPQNFPANPGDLSPTNPLTHHKLRLLGSKLLSNKRWLNLRAAHQFQLRPPSPADLFISVFICFRCVHDKPSLSTVEDDKLPVAGGGRLLLHGGRKPVKDVAFVDTELLIKAAWGFN